MAQGGQPARIAALPEIDTPDSDAEYEGFLQLLQIQNAVAYTHRKIALPAADTGIRSTAVWGALAPTLTAELALVVQVLGAVRTEAGSSLYGLNCPLAVAAVVDQAHYFLPSIRVENVVGGSHDRGGVSLLGDHIDHR